jgi:hypothetical protein
MSKSKNKAHDDLALIHNFNIMPNEKSNKNNGSIVNIQQSSKIIQRLTEKVQKIQNSNHNPLQNKLKSISNSVNIG